MNESIHVVGSFILAGILLYGLWQGTRRRRRWHERKQASAVRVIDKINTFPHFGQKIAYLRKIDPFVFEELLLEGFERRGFEVIRNRRYTGDGGIDGRVKIDGQTWLIQAKRYTSYIAVGHVRDFSDLLNATGARGFFCHTGKTREGTKSLIRGDSRMILVSGQKLLDLIATDAPFIPYPGYRPPTEMVHPEQETT
ncbi:restriction endonuclease [Escherichia coli]|uniref:restriction endonuclease n=1 Tax=Escherichia coli TaxID=562 RepID=UPI00351610E8